jgi:hypothetical protein
MNENNIADKQDNLQSTQSRKIFELLTHIVILNGGANLLGLLEFFAWVGVMALAVSVLEYKLLSAAIFIIGWFIIIGFDLLWRLKQVEYDKISRLFSPFCGGCFVFLPIWFVFSVGMIGLVILVLIKS